LNSFPTSAGHGTIADFFNFGVECGLFEIDCAKEWAYSIVESQSEPPIEIIDVATANSREDLSSALNSVRGERDTQLAGRWLLGVLGATSSQDLPGLRRDIQRAIQICRSTELSREIRYRFDLIDDELYLAENGMFGTVEESAQQFKRALLDLGVRLA